MVNFEPNSAFALPRTLGRPYGWEYSQFAAQSGVFSFCIFVPVGGKVHESRGVVGIHLCSKETGSFGK
jgi:hypothetical protein